MFARRRSHFRRLNSIPARVKGHIWDEFVASHPGDGAMRGMATELLGEDRVLHLVHVEAMEQRPTVGCAGDRLIRMSIAAAFAPWRRPQGRLVSCAAAGVGSKRVALAAVMTVRSGSA